MGKRKRVQTIAYLRELVLYIHNNPIHHGFCEHILDYLWSSYLTIVTVKATRLNKNEVFGWFDDQANFKYIHHQKVEIEKTEKYVKKLAKP